MDSVANISMEFVLNVIKDIFSLVKYVSLIL